MYSRVRPVRNCLGTKPFFFCNKLKSSSQRPLLGTGTGESVYNVPPCTTGRSTGSTASCNG